MPLAVTFAQPTTPQQGQEEGVKFSKLVKKARQLGCETFSRSVDAVMAKNWLKRVSYTLTDLELDDDLKLRVTTRLIDNSIATWWANLKLRAITSVT